MKKAFTMMELIFVIVVIGILASIALPKLWVTRDDAAIAKLRSDVASIRSSISTKYGKNVMSGIDQCPSLEDTTKDPSDNYVFEGVMTYPIKKNEGSVKWTHSGNEYNATVNGKTLVFDYLNNTTDNCKFECNTTWSTNNNCNLIGE
jgi:general secretion pathway protein G